jgi:hypothetical protein
MPEPTFYEAGPSTDALAAVRHCIENGTYALLFDRGALAPPFFDLSSGIAGEVAQKLVNYGIRMASVVPDLSAYSPHFRDFARESNRGRRLRFFATRDEAVAWLESE